ncbi:MFS transporter [Actinomadura rupiterrae]|uniref:MFS transporter n=1 Tax=Actinomadura rupiterrae TaxID=559627 RepID=UPI0020A5835E|nr:MFS transporter [Actinomadura rupiterrae]MCP2341437.1 DHA2 family methylenomycin A resistance protein-like MFS transporter [Actinomadura rupiterrae]
MTTVEPARVAQDARHRTAGPKLILATTFMGIFLLNLSSMAMNVALPGIGRDLGGSTAGLQWVVDAYTLMFAALLLSAGALSDRIGASRAFGAGVAVFTVASAACGLAPGLGELITARLVQGSAAAIMLPSSLALVRQAFSDAAERARAIALWTVGGAVAVAAGPVAGGVLASTLSWRAIFAVNLPVGIATLAVLTRAERSPRRIAPLDPYGQLTAVVALAALTFAVIDGGENGFGEPVVLGCLGLAAVATAAFIMIEARTAAPLIPLDLFRSRTVTVSVAIGFVVNAAFYGLVFVLSLFFQDVLDLSPMATGLMFLPMTAVIAGANLASARAAARFGPRFPIAVGQAVLALAMFGLLWIDVGTGRPVIASMLVPVGLGLGFFVPSLTAVLLNDIAADRAGTAAGILNSFRQTGGALAVAAFGALLAHGDEFMSGLRVGLCAAAVMLTATTVASLTLPRRQG